MKHKGSVVKAIFCKDESLILTWGFEAVQLWHTVDGSPATPAMAYHDSILGAILSKDENLVLTWSSFGPVRLWDIAADYDFPKEHLSLMIEAITGTKMDDQNNVLLLNRKEWLARKQKYKENYQKIIIK